MKRRNLTPMQAKAVKAMIKGNNVSDSMRIAGYSESTVQHQSNKLLELDHVKESLAKAGLTSEMLAVGLKDVIDMGIASGKASADTALHGIELGYKLRGELSPESSGDTSIHNTYIKELRVLPDDKLQERITILTNDISHT